MIAITSAFHALRHCGATVMEKALNGNTQSKPDIGGLVMKNLWEFAAEIHRPISSDANREISIDTDGTSG